MPYIQLAARRVPILNDVGIQLFFNGPESFTPDDRYILGAAPELPGYFVAAGFNSVGLQSAGGAGRALADWIVDGGAPMDLSDVDIRRFAPFQVNRRYLRDRTTETLGLLYDMHWPFRQMETGRGIRRSPFHDRLLAHGACFGELAGWERANWYAPAGVTAAYAYSYGRQNWFECSALEHRAVREGVGLFDQSSFGKLLVQGRDAERVLNRICTGDVAVEPGRMVYTQWLNEHGGIEADLTVTRLSEAEFLVVTAAATLPADLDWLRRSHSRRRPLRRHGRDECLRGAGDHGAPLAGTPPVPDRRRPIERGVPVRDVARDRSWLRFRPRLADHLRRRARLGALRPD